MIREQSPLRALQSLDEPFHPVPPETSQKIPDSRLFTHPHPIADRPLFIITKPFDGAAASAGNGQMIAFLANSRSLVDESYVLAIELGATSEGEPSLRPAYHADYYGAYFRDPDGNKLCVCCHEAA
jgi:catechol 2,3-dioxygenase-like lactoylglutathione lyase family enzyme